MIICTVKREQEGAMLENQGRVSVFKRLFILFGISMVVIYVSTIAIFLKYAQEQREREIDRLQSGILHNVSLLEQQLEIVYSLEQTLVVDDRVMSLASPEGSDNYQRSQLILALMGHLRSLKSMNNIIEDISLNFPGQSLEVDAEGNYRRKEYEALARAKGTTASVLLSEDGQVYMELLYPLTYSIEEDYVPDYGVRITLAGSYLEEFLELFGEGEETGAFLVLDGSGEMLLPTAKVNGESLYEGWKSAREKDKSAENFQGKARCDGRNYLFVSRKLPQYGMAVVAYGSTMALDRTAFLALLSLGVLLLIISILFLGILSQTNSAVNRPLQEVVAAFGQVQEGNLDIRIYHKPQDEFGYIYSSFNRMVERISQLIENVKEQGRLLQNAELIQLQSQINPHFLYNSFYLIRIMAKNESYEQIAQFVTSLAKYYRFINKEAEQNIPLEREAEHMGNYIDIQQMRFGDKITVEEEQILPEISGFKVPKLILQPIVENAYNYGMKDILENGKIYIRYRLEGKWLFVDIEDNGNGIDEKKLEQMRACIRNHQGRAAGHALSNIDCRLKLAYGEGCGVLLGKSELGGLRVSLKLDTAVEL